jgi:hypothetical protein
MNSPAKTYYPSLWRQLLSLLGCLFLIMLSWALAFHPRADASLHFWGWMGIVFFGLCAALAILQLIPGASFLRLDSTGFTVRSCWRDQFYPWADIEGFGVAKGTGSREWVGFNFIPGSAWAVKTRMREFNRTQMGYEAMLPDSYGWSPANLAEALSQWRRNSLGIAEPEPSTVAPEEKPGNGQPPPMLAWSNTKLKFSLGLGSLGLAALMGEVYGQSLPFWVVLPVILLPLCIFLFVQPKEGMSDRWVRRLQAFGACWYLIAAILFSCLFFSAETKPAALIIYPLCLIAGAIPCCIVLWRLWTGKMDGIGI